MKEALLGEYAKQNGPMFRAILVPTQPHLLLSFAGRRVRRDEENDPTILKECWSCPSVVTETILL